MSTRRVMRFKWGYLWVTGLLFLFSLIGHWLFTWFDYVSEAREHGEPIEIGEYVVKVGAATLENWQSEFLQLIWQVAGLMFLYSVGSPASKEGDARQEEKLDWIMRRLDPDQAGQRITELEEKYPKQ